MEKILPLIMKCNSIAYVLLAIPVMWIGSIALYTLAKFLAEAMVPDISPWLPPNRESSNFVDLFGIIVVSPVIETLIMKFSLILPIKNRTAQNKVCLVSGAIWGGLHALMGYLWFFGTFWHFYMYTFTYLIWEEKSRSGFSKVLILHMLNNGIVLALLLK